MDKIDEVLTRGVAEIFPSRKALEKVLRTGKKLRLYQGFDPSMPSLHLGNMVGLVKLRQFQALGHEVIFLVGDFTGMVGDPDKFSTRRQLTQEQVSTNSRLWKDQAGRFLNFGGKNPAKFLFNSRWLSKLNFTDLVEIASHLTYQQIIKRDLFQKRIKAKKDIHFHELLYPLMQGYDCVHMDVDLEVGGADQLFNILVGRDLIKRMKGKEKFVLTTRLLVDPKGAKVGKTTGNALFLDAAPSEMYGGVMAFPDEVVLPAFELLTFIPMEEIRKMAASSRNPMLAKKRLAFEIVRINFGKKEAEKAQRNFEVQFQKRRVPQQVPWTPGAVKPGKYPVSKIMPLLIPDFSGTATVSAAKRLIAQGGLEFDGKKVFDPQMTVSVKGGEIIRAGKSRLFKVRKK